MNKADANKSVHSIRMTALASGHRISDSSSRSKSPHRETQNINDDAYLPKFSSANPNADDIVL